MANSKVYEKSDSQTILETILHELKVSNICISELTKNEKHRKIQEKFDAALYDVINIIIHEKKNKDLIYSIADSFISQYNEGSHDFDISQEMISETFIGLYTPITKGENLGRIRIDTYQDKEPEAFVAILRHYIANNIIRDSRRQYARNDKHTETLHFVSEDDGSTEEIKCDSVEYNKAGIERSYDFSDSLCRNLSYEPTIGKQLITAVINRFGSRSPHKAYVYLSILAKEYEPKSILEKLTTIEFNKLYTSLITSLEKEYDLDLTQFKRTEFEPIQFIESLKSASKEIARHRIDNLVSKARNDVQKLAIFKSVKENHIRIVGSNLFLI